MHGTMIDVGGHYGGSCERFARNGWTVFVFEPDPENRKILGKTCSKYPSVIVDSRAVTDVDDEHLSFYASAVSSGISGLSAFHKTHQVVAKVRTVTLGRIISEQEISKIDFLKVDTEGFDMFVLKGLPWDEIRPIVLVCEFEDRKTRPLGYSFVDLVTYITSKGYDVLVSEWYPIIEYGKTHRWRRFARYPMELSDSNAWGNIIAVRKDSGLLFDSLCEIAEEYSSEFS
jgi:FkbM family methyltransferase